MRWIYLNAFRNRRTLMKTAKERKENNNGGRTRYRRSLREVSIALLFDASCLKTTEATRILDKQDHPRGGASRSSFAFLSLFLSSSSSSSSSQQTRKELVKIS